jgi:hypothetical protein
MTIEYPFPPRIDLLGEARITATDIEKLRLLKNLIERIETDMLMDMRDIDNTDQNHQEEAAVLRNAKRELYDLQRIVSDIH